MLWLLGLCWLVLSACEQDQRVPYIPPTLANWPQPYHGVSGVKLHAFTTGVLHVDEALLLRGGSLTQTRELPVPAFVIEHPKQGLVLFNTGVNPVLDTDAAWPGGWLGLVGAEVVPGEALRSQLEQAGLKPDAVRWIVLSTLRFDHTGAVEAFPNARVVVATAERDFARQAPSGYKTNEFDAVANWKFIDFESATPLATFTAHVDLFGDGSVLLIDARGATPGTMAMLVRLPQRPVLLADDLAALEENVRYATQPPSAYDMQDWWEHIWRLKRFKDLVPELIVVPGHDLQPLQSVHAREIVVHAFTPGASGRPTPTPNALRRLLPAPM